MEQRSSVKIREWLPVAAAATCAALTGIVSLRMPLISILVCAGLLGACALVVLIFGWREQWFYYVLVPLVPFSQSVPIVSLGNRSVNLGLDTVLVSVLVLWHLACRPILTRRSFCFDRISAVLVLWLVWNLLTIVLSAVYLQPGQVMECLVVLSRWGQYVPVFVILAEVKLSVAQCRRTITLLVITAAAATLLGWIQLGQGLGSGLFKGVPSFTAPLFREADPNQYVDDLGWYTGSANYNVFGAYMVLAFSMLLPFVLSTTTTARKIFGSCLLLFFASGVFITFSRISVFALFVSFLYGLYQYSKRTFRRTLVVMGLGLVAAFVLLQQVPLIKEFTETSVRVWEVIPLVLRGDNYLSGTSDASATVFGAALRVVGIRNAVEVFAAHPITGFGFNAYQYFGLTNTPDNYFMEMLAETGIVGFGLLVGFLWLIMRSTTIRRDTLQDSFVVSYRQGFRCAVICMILVNLTSGIFYIQKVWGPFLIVSGVWLCLRDGNQSDRKPADV